MKGLYMALSWDNEDKGVSIDSGTVRVPDMRRCKDFPCHYHSAYRSLLAEPISGAHPTLSSTPSIKPSQKHKDWLDKLLGQLIPVSFHLCAPPFSDGQIGHRKLLQLLEDKGLTKMAWWTFTPSLSLWVRLLFKVSSFSDFSLRCNFGLQLLPKYILPWSYSNLLVPVSMCSYFLTTYLLAYSSIHIVYVGLYVWFTIGIKGPKSISHF